MNEKERGERTWKCEHIRVGGGLHSFDLTESRGGRGPHLNVRLTQGVAHQVIGVVVDVLVGRAVNIEVVGAPPLTVVGLGSTLMPF